jgi:arylsulfatase A-like enzyme
MAERLNVLLIVVGGARSDRLSCAGHDRETTPCIDQLAREGVRFTQAITTAPATAAAHASLLTGLFAATHGTTEENPLLSPGPRTLAEILRAAGYRTAAFCTDPAVSPETGFGRGFDRFYTQRTAGRLRGTAARYARSASDRVLGRGDAGARRINRSLLDWLHLDAAPFFAYAHYAEAVLPCAPPAPYDRMFLPRTSASKPSPDAFDAEAAAAGALRLSAVDAVALHGLFDGALRYIDMRLKELLDALAARDALDHTLIVVTSDHGQALGDRGAAGFRGDLHDEVLRIPLVLRCPPAVPQGFVVEELAQSTDLFPTILELVGVDSGEVRLQGRPLLRNGQVTTGPDCGVAESYRPDLAAVRQRFPAADLRSRDVRQKALRCRREKFVWRSDEANQLFDLSRDPGERTNLFASEPERAERMRRRLFSWLAAVERSEDAQAALAEGWRAERIGGPE